MHTGLSVRNANDYLLELPVIALHCRHGVELFSHRQPCCILFTRRQTVRPFTLNHTALANLINQKFAFSSSDICRMLPTTTFICHCRRLQCLQLTASERRQIQLLFEYIKGVCERAVQQGLENGTCLRCFLLGRLAVFSPPSTS